MTRIDDAFVVGFDKLDTSHAFDQISLPELPDRTSADFPGGPNEHDSPPPIFGYCFSVREKL
jgi:hypothetical protein